MSYLTQNFGDFSWILHTDSLFVASIHAVGLSLVACEFLWFSRVNFETTGLLLKVSGHNMRTFYCFLSFKSEGDKLPGMNLGIQTYLKNPSTVATPL